MNSFNELLKRRNEPIVNQPGQPAIMQPEICLHTVSTAIYFDRGICICSKCGKAVYVHGKWIEADNSFNEFLTQAQKK